MQTHFNVENNKIEGYKNRVILTLLSLVPTKQRFLAPMETTRCISNISHLFILQIFTECLLHARHSSRCL